MITVSYSDANNRIDIFFDKACIALLIMKINELNEDYEHVHVYATGDDRGLSLKAMREGQKVFGEVILERFPTDEWVDPE